MLLEPGQAKLAARMSDGCVHVFPACRFHCVRHALGLDRHLLHASARRRRQREAACRASLSVAAPQSTAGDDLPPSALSTLGWCFAERCRLHGALAGPSCRRMAQGRTCPPSCWSGLCMCGRSRTACTLPSRICCTRRASCLALAPPSSVHGCQSPCAQWCHPASLVVPWGGRCASSHSVALPVGHCHLWVTVA